MPANLRVLSRAERPDLKKAASAIEQAAWNESGYLNYTRAHYEYYSDLLNRYPEYQLCLVDEDAGYPVGVASSVPFTCSDQNSLPPEGWDWVVETAARTDTDPANMLGALAISVPDRPSLEGLRQASHRGACRPCEGQGVARRRGAGSSIGQGTTSLGADRGISELDRRKGSGLRPLASQPSLAGRKTRWALRTFNGRARTHRVLGELVEISVSRRRATMRWKALWHR